MGLQKRIDKLNRYFGRLDEGKAHKIKPSHVEKIILKLKAKRQALQEEVALTEKEDKKLRLEHKLDFVKEQIDRAKWLLREVENGKKT